MASNVNKATRTKQWLVFGVVAACLIGTSILVSQFASNKAADRAPPPPKTVALNTGITQAEKDAAGAESQARLEMLTKRLDGIERKGSAGDQELANKVASIEAALKNQAPTKPAGSANAPPAPPEGFTGANPFRSADGNPPPPTARTGKGVGLAPGQGGGRDAQGAVETVSIDGKGVGGESGGVSASLTGLADSMNSSAAKVGREEHERQVARQREIDARGEKSSSPRGSLGRASDDPLASNRADGRDAATYIPAGTYLRVVVLNGLDAPTGGQSQQNPHPVLLQAADDAVMPNAFRAALKDCMITANGYGDIAAERAYIRTDRLSCIDNEGGAIDVALKGYVSGEDGKTGMRGRVVEKTGRILANALFSAVGSGFGQAFKNQGVVQTTNPFGGQAEQVTDGFKAGFGTGVSKAFDKITDYYLKVAEKMFPIVEISGGRVVDVVITRGISIERGSKPKSNSQ